MLKMRFFFANIDKKVTYSPITVEPYSKMYLTSITCNSTLRQWFFMNNNNNRIIELSEFAISRQAYC